MAEKKDSNLIFENFNNFLACYIFVLFSILLFFVLTILYIKDLDIIGGLEKVFLVFEGILGAIIGYYFGHQPVESAEKRANIAVKEKSEAVAKALPTIEIAQQGLIEKEKELRAIEKERDDFQKLLKLAIFGSIEEVEKVKKAIEAAQIL